MAEQNIKLTKLASCGGCGAKVGAGVLAQLLDIRIRYFTRNNVSERDILHNKATILKM